MCKSNIMFHFILITFELHTTVWKQTSKSTKQFLIIFLSSFQQTVYTSFAFISGPGRPLYDNIHHKKWRCIHPVPVKYYCMFCILYCILILPCCYLIIILHVFNFLFNIGKRTIALLFYITYWFILPEASHLKEESKRVDQTLNHFLFLYIHFSMHQHKKKKVQGVSSLLRLYFLNI